MQLAFHTGTRGEGVPFSENLMSTRSACIALERSHGTPAEKLVLFYLADAVDYAGHVALSQLPELCAAALTTEDEFASILSTLEAEGWFVHGATDIDGDPAIYFALFDEESADKARSAQDRADARARKAAQGPEA